MTIHHVVFYKLKPSVKEDKAVVEEICSRTRKMSKEIGLAESFVTGPPTPDTVQAAQGYDIMAVSTYKDADTLDRYNNHELHQAFVKWNKANNLESMMKCDIEV